MTLTEQQVQQLATAAHVAPNTVRRFVAGREIWPSTRMRILSALKGKPEFEAVVRRFGA